VLHGAEPVIDRAIAGEKLSDDVATEAVEGSPLSPRCQESLLVALAVDGDQVVSELGEHRRRHRTPAQESAAATFLSNGSRHDQHPVVEVATRFVYSVKDRWRGDADAPFDLRPGVSGSHNTGIRAAAEQQP
jgi:hypothetical protein